LAAPRSILGLALCACRAVPLPAPDAPHVTPATWLPRGDGAVTLYDGSEVAVVVRDPSALTATQAAGIDFERELVLAVGGPPIPSARLATRIESTLASGIRVWFRPYWTLRGCTRATRGWDLLAETDRFLGVDRQPGVAPVLVMESDGAPAIVVPARATIDCPTDVSELLSRPPQIPALTTELLAEARPVVSLGTDTVLHYPHVLDVLDVEAGVAVPDGRAPIKPSSENSALVRLPQLHVEAPRYAPCRRTVRVTTKGGASLELRTNLQRSDLPTMLVRIPKTDVIPHVRRVPGPPTKTDASCATRLVPRTEWDVDGMIVRFGDGARSADPPEAPLRVRERGGNLVVTLGVPVERVVRRRGCEGFDEEPCDSVPIPTGRTRISEGWSSIFERRYRVPESRLPIVIRLELAPLD
jgi:hypothetical protein